MWDFFYFIDFLILFVIICQDNQKIKNMRKSNQKLSTLVMFKPMALKRHGVNHMLLELARHAIVENFTIAEVKTTRLTKQQAQEFYAEHEGKDFYNVLVNFISSRDVVAIRIEYLASDLEFISRFRKKVIGSTDPNKALPGTMRHTFGAKKEFAEGLPANAVHASDSRESAARELAFFFTNYLSWIWGFTPFFLF